MKRVLIESPFGTNPDGTRADVDTMLRNVTYLQRIIRKCLEKGYAPFASHGFYPQVLDDTVPEQRKNGIEAGFAWANVAEIVIVGRDYGLTQGMRMGIERAEKYSQPIEMLWIGLNP